MVAVEAGRPKSGHPGKGLNFSFQGDRLGREGPVLQVCKGFLTVVLPADRLWRLEFLKMTFDLRP